MDGLSAGGDATPATLFGVEEVILAVPGVELRVLDKSRNYCTPVSATVVALLMVKIDDGARRAGGVAGASSSQLDSREADLERPWAAVDARLTGCTT